VVAEQLNCTSAGADAAAADHDQSVPGSPDNANLVQCLRRYSADRLANVNVAAGVGGGRPIAVPWYSATFGPTLDGAGVGNVVTDPLATAASMIDELCGGDDGVGGDGESVVPSNTAR